MTLPVVSWQWLVARNQLCPVTGSVVSGQKVIADNRPMKVVFRGLDSVFNYMFSCALPRRDAPWTSQLHQHH